MDKAPEAPSISTRSERGSLTHELLTIKEAAAAMQVSLSLGYQLAHEYLNSGGTAGLRCCRSGPACAYDCRPLDRVSRQRADVGDHVDAQ
jgi:hypothetical protein